MTCGPSEKGYRLVVERHSLIEVRSSYLEYANTALRADASAKAPPTRSDIRARLTAAANAVPAQESAGERRHVTVMFCDLVDSTGIVAGLDARRVA